MNFFINYFIIYCFLVLKVNGIAALMKEAEMELHKELFKQFMKKSKLEEEDFDHIVSVKLAGPKLLEYFVKQGMSKEEAEIVTKRIESFRRFRVRYLYFIDIFNFVILDFLLEV